MLIRPSVRSRTLLAQISAPLTQGKAVPSTTDRRYSSLYLAWAWATGRPKLSKVAAAAVALKKVRSFMVCLLFGFKLSSTRGKSVAQLGRQPQGQLRKGNDQQHDAEHGNQHGYHPADGAFHAHVGDSARHHQVHGQRGGELAQCHLQ